MERIQIQFTVEQLERLRQAAALAGVSVAQMVRDSVDAHLTVPGAEERRRALQHLGGFRSGRRDVARGHDTYLTEDLG